ncbi:hypothetical protein RhiXN_07619 [Rhizoctonia solani]|uniref:Uncharacterized protein n=1 Tax=Rhizoctonia solani TaxID=456999 RepID=A0A8H8P2E9_9AGAM|nr:uncharacterized protein RhiXN_07619 [Rhizoctonia solani]QRW22583.1 hypothetical protein RhiXN_07619 [Rhizoctonia solani]
MRRATERGEVAQARYMRQAQAAAVFEASRFAARTLREQQGRKGRPLSPLGGLPDRGDRAGYIIFNVASPQALAHPLCRNFLPLWLLLTKIHLHTLATTIYLRSMANALQAALRSIGLINPRHHHHHSRQAAKDSNPNRLTQTKEATIESDVTVTLIAPPSVHLRDVHFGLAKIKVPRSSIGDGTSPGIPGIIDLVQNSCDGEKLGGLSVSRFLADDRNISDSSSILLLLIDSTPNLVDQATFFVRPFEDQSVLEYDHPSVGTSQDLLVALEVPSAPNNSWLKQLCATFNPLDSAIQTFGLALCMNQGSAINNRRMSQAFRYSPHNGILAPYYGAEETKEAVLAAVNERIQAMESDDGNRTSAMSGGTGPESMILIRTL